MRESKSKIQCIGKRSRLLYDMFSTYKLWENVLSTRTSRGSNRWDCHAQHARGSNYIIDNMCKVCSLMCKRDFDAAACGVCVSVCVFVCVRVGVCVCVCLWVCVWGGGESTGGDSSQSSPQCFCFSNPSVVVETTESHCHNEFHFYCKWILVPNICFQSPRFIIISVATLVEP